MIRIDEIYNNIFLQKMQAKPLRGLHWFDPFGSVSFEDLHSVPAVPWNDRAERYLFWDQEPLHVATTDRTIQQFKQMYNGRHHIITSEYDSEYVDRVASTYNMQPHYYFYHGWAALDWFRGYDRTYLMSRARDRCPSKTFISPNRIVAGERDHRVLFLYNVFKNGLDDNHISAPRTCQYEGIDIAEIAEKYRNQYPDIVTVLQQARLPRLFSGEDQQLMHSYCLGNFTEAADSLVYVATETVYTGRRQHLTEKTFKAIALEMPFVLVAPAGSLAYLRKYGFKTFDPYIDETYDTITDPYLRIEAVAAILLDLQARSAAARAEFWANIVPRVEYNRQHFYSGGFEAILWQELTTMLQEF